MQTCGSEWNRWDLHFHTPTSHDYKNKSVSDEQIIDVMADNHIKVFAITDHNTIDIDRFRRLKDIGNKKGITVLPGIEFLSDARGKEPVHFIGVFDENCNIEHVWGQISNLTAIKKIAGENAKHDEVYCDLEETIKLVRSLGGITTIHAGDKSGSIENITHALPHSMAQKTDIAKLVDIYELGKEDDQEGYKKYVFPSIGKIIPMIICSDNHNIAKYVIKQKLWIKGSPSFAGLKYALNEPESRFFIGDEPPLLEKIRSNKTKYIKEIVINERNGENRKSVDNIWFRDIKIPLNNELVTIIGHKGSGKSAIADILALCTDCEHSEDYVFLHPEKFKKKGLAENYQASVTFQSNTSTAPRPLNHTIEKTSTRLARYLPQNYFEKICNEINKVEALRDEIEKVVFQYIPIEKRQGQQDFQSLLHAKKEASQIVINNLHRAIENLNEIIINKEDEINPEYKKKIESKLDIKKKELIAALESRPVEVPDPSKQSESADSIEKRTKINELKENLKKIEKEIEEVTSKISDLEIAKSKISAAKSELSIQAQIISASIDKYKDIISLYGIEIEEIISFEFKKEKLESVITTITSEIESLKRMISKEENDSQDENLIKAKNSVSIELSRLEKGLSDEQQKYHRYLNDMTEWNQKILQIKGSETDLESNQESIEYLSARLLYIQNHANDDLKKLRSERIQKVLELYDEKCKIKSIYDEVKSNIDIKLQKAANTKIKIASSFQPSEKLMSTALGYINKGTKGTFYGVTDAEKIFKDELLGQTNWNNRDSVANFLTEIIEYLEIDKRPLTTNTGRQFIGNAVPNRKGFYDFIFSLSYVDPKYNLEQNGKGLEQLSPGEKGAILLVFYLVLDQEDIPLIIDQPEDNLDNNSIATVLVPYIREAKKNRQIIIVTHNPNIAVVSDSEQVIKVNLDKENGNKFSFTSGGIEDEEIRNEIIEVLEGTAPAFSSRRVKYKIQ